MKNQDLFKKNLKFVLFIGFGIFVAWWFIKDLDEESRQQIKTSFYQANYFYVVLALIFGAFSFWLRAKRWQMQIESMNYFPKTKNVLMVVTVGYFANLAFPRFGDILRCGLLEKYEKVPTAKTLGATITERVLDLFCFGLLLLWILIIEFSRLSGFAKDNFEELYKTLSNPVFLNILIISGIVALSLFLIFFIFLRKLFSNNFIYKKIKSIVLQLIEGLISLKNVKRPTIFVLYTLALWFCYFIMAYIVFFSISATSNLPLSAGLACLVFGTIGIMVTPGGFGLYPVLIAATLVLYGVEQPFGFALGWLIWASQNIMIILFGMISLILLPIFNLRQKR